MLAKEVKKRKEITEKSMQALERRVRAYQLRIRGYSYRRIGDELGVSYGTIKRDLDQIAKEMGHKFEDFDPNEFVAGEMQGYDDLMQEGWNQYHQSMNVNQAVKALEFIRGTKMDRFNMLKTAGAIKTEPVKVEHEVSVGVTTHWNDDVKKIATEAIIQGMLGQKQLAEPIPDDINPDNVIDINDELDDDDDDEDTPTNGESVLQ